MTLTCTEYILFHITGYSPRLPPLPHSQFVNNSRMERGALRKQCRLTKEHNEKYLANLNTNLSIQSLQVYITVHSYSCTFMCSVTRVKERKFRKHSLTNQPRESQFLQAWNKLYFPSGWGLVGNLQTHLGKCFHLFVLFFIKDWFYRP